MVVNGICGNVKSGAYDGRKKVINVPFEWYELEKKRICKYADNGMKLGICIDETMRDGDILYETDDVVYAVSVLACHLIRIYVHTMEEMGRLCFEIGNRHLSLKISNDVVKIPYDLPTFDYLQKLGFDVSESTEEFTDYIVCKAHGHGSMHNHTH